MYFVDKDGNLVESDLEAEELGSGFTPASPADLQRHNEGVDYDEKPFSAKAAETIRAGFDAGARTVSEGIALVPGAPELDRNDPSAFYGGQIGPHADEARGRADRHPVAVMVGQGAALAPLMLTPGGAAVGVLGEATAGGYAAEAEAAWQSNREFSQEAAWQNVGAGLLVGGGLMLGAKGVSTVTGKLGRNLFTEAEHASSTRAARELLDDVPTTKDAPNLTADDIAKRGPDDPGVAYIRENADTLTDELATKQAKAAQELLDTYGEMAPLRQTAEEVSERIPDNQLEQARWVTRARDEVSAAVDELPPEIAAPLRERVDALADGDDPAQWFVASTELSDDLLRARTKALRAEAKAGTAGDIPVSAPDELAPPLADQILRAKETIDAGLADAGLWGNAARIEGQRAAGYAKRYGEHIDEFEHAFTSELPQGRKIDPGKFRTLLDGTADPAAAKSLQATIESARVTADVAAKFGRKEEAARILAAVDTIEKTARQADAVRLARATGAKAETNPAQAALEWLARNGAGTVAEEAVDGGMKAAGAMIGGAIGGPVGMAAGWLGGRYLSKQLGEAVVTGVSNAAAQAAAGRLSARGGVFKAVAAMADTASGNNRRGVQRLLSRPIEAANRTAEGLRIVAPKAASITAINFDSHRDHLDRMANDPQYFGDVMAQSFGTMPAAAPEVFSGLSEQSAKVVQYLNTIAPGGKSGGPFGQRFAVSEDELWEYSQRFQAVSDPDFVRDELEAGRLSSQAIEAFEHMMPHQYAQLQLDVFERLEELNAQGVPVSIQAREQIDVLLGIDGGGDPALTWKVAERAYGAIARKNASRSQGAAGPSDPGEQGMTSGALSTLNNGASAIAQTG